MGVDLPPIVGVRRPWTAAENGVEEVTVVTWSGLQEPSDDVRSFLRDNAGGIPHLLSWP